MADNRLGELAAWDEDALGMLLTQLAAEDGLEGVGYTEDELATLMDTDEEEAESSLDDPGPEPPPDLPVSKMGVPGAILATCLSASCQTTTG